MAKSKYPKHDHDYSIVTSETTDPATGEKVVAVVQKCRICGKPKP